MRIILADHNRSTLWALRTVLEEEPGMEIVGEAVEAHQLQVVAAGSNADLVLLDRRLHGGNIETLISRLYALSERPFVVVMTNSAEDGRLMLRIGADAFVNKADSPDRLLDTLHRYAERVQQGSRPE